MKAWAERTAGERTGLIVSVVVAVAAAVFGAVQCSAPRPDAGATAPAATDAPAAPDQTAAEAPAAGETAEAAPAEPAPEPAADPAPEAAPEADPAAVTAADAAPAEPAAETAAEPAAPAEPAAADAVAPPAPAAPEFDLVRVSRDGSAVIAGSAAPGATVRLLLDGVEIGSVPADATGSFVALFNLAPSDAPRILTLLSVLPDGTELPAAGRIAISPTVAPDLPALAAADPAATAAAGTGATAATDPAAEPAAPAAPESPAALLVTEEGARVLQSAGDIAPGMASNVTVDAITYTPEGDVQLAGRGTGGAVVRLYLDNAQVSDATIDGQGNWAVTLGGVAPGLYTLRADQIGPDGAVTSRFETPFQRETVEALAAAATAAADAATAAEPVADAAEPAAAADTPAEPAPAAAPVSITVQPGFTLWRIARENLGDGILYVQVFEANKAQIRDPDLIYPGQVFAIPSSD